MSVFSGPFGVEGLGCKQQTPHAPPLAAAAAAGVGAYATRLSLLYLNGVRPSHPEDHLSGTNPARLKEVCKVFSLSGTGKSASMRDLKSWACFITTRKPVHPRNESGPHSAKGSGSIRPSVAAICSVRSRHSCWLLICWAAHVSTCARYRGSLSHSRRSSHRLRTALTCVSQCSCPSRAFFCMSGRSLTCSPDRPTASSRCRLRLAATAARAVGFFFTARASSSDSSLSASASASATRDAARAAAARWGRWVGASSS
mmetsp:Transcript_23232/g.45080  ORF Transcript_23232/g.45080 Transcript_23232/m.45080 type:complete len:257 (+) Transcript_23232:73-843(+)